MGKTVQIRNLDDRAYTVMRTRAAQEHLSLAAYLRRQIEQWAGKPTMAELLERADRRRQQGMHVSGTDIVAAVRETRDEEDD